MIINESNNRQDYEELTIKNPSRFISAIGGIVDSGMKESEDFILTEKSDEEIQKEMEKQIRQILNQNKMSVPPTPREIQRSGNKIKVPWFLVGTLLSKAHTYGLEKRAKDR